MNPEQLQLLGEINERSKITHALVKKVSREHDDRIRKLEWVRNALAGAYAALVGLVYWKWPEP